MEFFYLALAFLCGLCVKMVGLPPLVGYLLAGFFLSAFGVGNQENSVLTQLSDLGITLMLFTIGLKLHFKDLWKKEVLLAGSIHMLISAIFFAIGTLLITFLLPYISDLNHQQAMLIGFILSFSSTICALKILQEGNALGSRHGKITMSILVLQDVFAVLFLVFSSGEIPSVWALLLPTLFLVKPMIHRLIYYAGHGELLHILGILLALAGYTLFDAVNIKGDLGALLIGMLISTHSKQNEIVSSLSNFKDLLLLGFFLSIGLIGLPDWSAITLALVLTLFIPLKHVFFYALFTLFKLRSRTSYLTSTLLSNYGEFGLIVAYIGVSIGLISEFWLTTLGLTVSISLIITSVCYAQTHKWYYSLSTFLTKYQRQALLPEDELHYPNNIDVLIVGAGLVGSSALVRLNQLHASINAWVIDRCSESVRLMQDKGLNTFCADAEDSDFWHVMGTQNIQFILIALPSVEESLQIIDQLKKAHYQGKIIAIATYDDDREKLYRNGVHATFNIFQEAGAKLAEDSLNLSKSA